MYIAADIGGTNIRVAFSPDINDLSNNIKRHSNIPITNNYATDLNAILQAVDTIYDHEHKKLNGICIGLPGVMAEDGKTIMVGANIPGWIGKQLGVDLENILDCKIFIENDDTIAAYGEAKYGFGKGQNFVYHTWGTGFGGAKVEQSDGLIHVRQFEAGHHIIHWNEGRLCGCGQTGCAEAYIGGNNIEKYYGKQVSMLSANEWDEVLTSLAQTLLNTLVYNPTSLIILGGGIAINQKDKLGIITNKLQERLRVYPAPELRITSIGDDLGLYGAFAVLKERLAD